MDSHNQNSTPDPKFSPIRETKMKKCKRFQKLLLCQLVICVASTFLIFLYLTAKQYPDSRRQFFISMEESIRSKENGGMCKIPNLPLDNPEMMPFFNPSERLQCDRFEDNWIDCEESRCAIDPVVVEKYGNVSCLFRELLWKSEDEFEYGKSEQSHGNYVLKESDFAEVHCRAGSNAAWSGVVVGTREVEPTVKASTTEVTPLLNILVLGFGSLSRNAFRRKLPQTYQYLTGRLDAHILKGYNIVGDGTTKVLIPMLTGRTELELPETRRGFLHSRYVDDYPFVWKEYHKKGYITAFIEDEAKQTVFSYRMNGFQNQPTDHNMKPLQLRLSKPWTANLTKLCIGSKPKHRLMLDYLRNLMISNQKHPKFVFSFQSELSRDPDNRIDISDEDIVKWLRAIKKYGILKNTVLIVMSDHGSQLPNIRKTLQGKQEERLPFMSFLFPEGFKNRYPIQYENFLNNIDLLTTPFDVHASLLDILMLQDPKLFRLSRFNERKFKRGISLFDEIPMTRSCSDAYIQPHWCTCLRWTQISITDKTSNLLTRLATVTRDTINNYTEIYRDYCEILKDGLVEWVVQLKPNDDLLKFRGSKDIDGYEADLTGSTEQSFDLYQAQVLFGEYNMLYEVTIRHKLKEDMFETSVRDMLRINEFKEQSRCMTNPDFRKYCQCGSNNY